MAKAVDENVMVFDEVKEMMQESIVNVADTDRLSICFTAALRFV